MRCVRIILLFWVVPAYASCFLPFLETVTPILYSEDRIHWKSEYLNDTPLYKINDLQSFPYRIQWMVSDLSSPNSEIRLEMKKNRIIHSRNNWYDLYVLTLDVFLFHPSYRNILMKAAEVLPNRGTIIDLGASSGIASTYFLHHSPNRYASLVEAPEFKGFFEIAKRRLATLKKTFRRRFQLVYSKLGGRMTKLPTWKGEGAFLNHILYTLKSQVDRVATLKALWHRLKDNAVVVVNEPLFLSESTDTRDFYKEWLGNVFIEAASLRPPSTEFEFVFLYAFSNRLLSSMIWGTQKQQTYNEIDEDAWIKTFWLGGFKTKSIESTYDGFSRFFILQKASPYNLYGSW